MLPFLEIPQITVNNEEKEKEVIRRIQPTEIESYYPGFYYGTCVVMKSKEMFLCTLSVENFDNALLAYHKAISSMSCDFGNLQLTVKPSLHATN